MNRKTLQKVLDELKKENADISYVRGILETLIESLPEESNKTVIQTGSTVKIPLPTAESIPGEVSAGRIAEIARESAKMLG